MNNHFGAEDQIFSDFMQPFEQASPIGYLDSENLTKKDSLENFESSGNRIDCNRQMYQRRKKPVTQFSQQVFEGMKQLLPEIQEEIKKQMQAQFEIQCQRMKLFYQKQAERVISQKQKYLRDFYQKEVDRVREKANEHAQERIKQTIRAWREDYQREKINLHQNSQFNQKLVISERKNVQLQKRNQELLKQTKRLQNLLQSVNQQRVHWTQQQCKYSDTIRQLTQKLTDEMEKNIISQRQPQQIKTMVSKWETQGKLMKKNSRKFTESELYQENSGFCQLNSQDFEEIQNFTSYEDQNCKLFNENLNEKQNQMLSAYKNYQKSTNFATSKESHSKPIKTQRFPSQMPLKLKQRQVSLNLIDQVATQKDKQNQKNPRKQASFHSTVQKQKKIDFLLYDSTENSHVKQSSQKINSNRNILISNGEKNFVSVPETSKRQISDENCAIKSKTFWDIDKKKKLLEMIRQKL